MNIIKVFFFIALSWIRNRSKAKQEHRLINKALYQFNFHSLNQFLRCSEPFYKYGKTYVSFSGRIRVKDDTMGYDIRIDDRPRIDLYPAEYGLVPEEAHFIYESILQCIPGTEQFKNAQKRNGCK